MDRIGLQLRQMARVDPYDSELRLTKPLKLASVSQPASTANPVDIDEPTSWRLIALRFLGKLRVRDRYRDPGRYVPTLCFTGGSCNLGNVVWTPEAQAVDPRRCAKDDVHRTPTFDLFRLYEAAPIVFTGLERPKSIDRTEFRHCKSNRT